MADNSKSLEDLKANVQQALEKTAEQTRGALNSYFDFIQRAISSHPAGGSDLGEKLKTYTDKNISAAHELAPKLSQAKDLQDVVRIQTEFMQMQLNAFGEQAKSLGEEFTKIATGVMKTPFKSS
jgi:hypothetical protein